MRLYRYFSIALLFGTLTYARQPVFAQEWLQVREGKLFGISGIASIETREDTASFLVVHDNKGDDRIRLAIVSLSATDSIEYLPLAWPEDWELPIDLESLTMVPQTDRPDPCFMAASSSGRVFYFSFDAAEVSIEPIAVFELPDVPSGSNLEGFALQEIAGRLLAVWADRGSGERAAIVYWGELDLAALTVNAPEAIAVRVPWPEGNVRHISDLKVDDRGGLTITSAMDSGDDGPFDSAVYHAGTFAVDGEAIAFEAASELRPVARYDGRKIEAIELLTAPVGGTILGTDDENFGSSIVRFVQ
ncbi:MAG: hypothetical protein SWY16_00485 [Cyanobacteriota bacterium]|nr:hypothetical protein [Cyanobacteriota bacterium]